ncbi:MAG: hypothetical protein CL678_07960 [Bdellovibrionaceae bacterium]|nr:hypothetical protein [Pseudobdellovibrionaceae bacterium]
MVSENQGFWKGAAYWDSRYREGNTPWQMSGPSSTLISLLSEASLSCGATVLVPGCGTGADALYFAHQGFQVSAVDFSKTAVDDLRVQARRCEVPLEVLRSDFFDIPSTWNQTFDLVVEHTFFCAIDPKDRENYVSRVKELLKPQGLWIGALFLTNEKELYAAPLFMERNGPPFLTSVDVFKKLFSNDFEMKKLEMSQAAHPKRQGNEWAALLQLKK